MNTMSPNKTIIWSRRGILFAALVGLFASAYLLYTYTTGSHLVCGSLVHGCDTVRASKWSSMFGLPTPLFGVLFYLTVVIIIIFRTYSPNYKPKLAYFAQVLFGVAGLAESIYLTSIQIFIIQQYCSWCITSAFAATAIFCFVLLDRHRQPEVKDTTKELKIIGITLVVFIVVGGIIFSQLIKSTAKPFLKPEFIQSPTEAFKTPLRPTATQTIIDEVTSTANSSTYTRKEITTGSKMQNIDIIKKPQQ